MPSLTSIAAWVALVLAVLNAAVTWRKHWWETTSHREERKRREWCLAKLEELRSLPPSVTTVPVADAHREWAKWGHDQHYFLLFVRPSDAKLFLKIH